MLRFHAQTAAGGNRLASFSYCGNHERSCPIPSAGDGEHLERSTEIEHFDIIKYDDANVALLLKAGLCLNHDSRIARSLSEKSRRDVMFIERLRPIDLGEPIYGRKTIGCAPKGAAESQLGLPIYKTFHRYAVSPTGCYRLSFRLLRAKLLEHIGSVRISGIHL